VAVVKWLGTGVLVGGAGSVAGQVLLAACLAERWNAQSMRHCDWAVRRCFFLLVLSKLVIPLLMCTPSIVSHEWSQLGKLASFILISYCPAWSTIG
jgi:hypothetical protein